MSFEALQERLAELQDTTSQLKVLIDRLANLKFQPGSLPLGGNSIGSSDDENNVATELSTEISQALRDAEEDLELLREETTDLRGGRPGSEAEHEKARLQDRVARLAQEFKATHISFRRAQFAAHRSLEEARRLERELFLASLATSAPNSPPVELSDASSPVLQQQQHQQQEPRSLSPSSANNTTQPQQPQQSQPQQHLFSARDRRRFAQRQASSSTGAGDDTAVVGASGDVTAALRRTQALIAGELARSAFARQTLAESTAALAGLQQTYAGLDGALARSRDLVGALLTSRKSDSWYLQTTLYMLLATLVWLVFRRFLYAPLWWVVWLPARTAWRTGRAVSSVGSGGSGGGVRMEVVGSGGGQTGRGAGVEDGRDAVPTVRVGGDGDSAVRESDRADSMVDRVGRIVDGTGDNNTSSSSSERDGSAENRTAQEASSKDQPNPKKRMWEEDKEAAKEAERKKDEL